MALLSAGLLPAFNSARAAPATDLDIPAAPLPQQLAALAIHTDISIGGLDPAKCVGQTVAVRGNFAPGPALQKLLMHTNCVATAAGQRTWRLAFRPTKPEPKPAFPIPMPVARESEGEVMVVINRRPQQANAAASALSVVPSSVIESGAYDIAQLASHVPGMAVTNLGPGRDKILLRGLSDSVLTGRTQSLVGLYLDDTPLTYNAPDPDLLLVDMARVEVLKGPQGALYGQGSMSGAVRLVTNKPQLDAFAAGVDAGIGLSQRGQPSDRVSAVLNLPLLHNVFGARLVAYDENSGGFIKDPLAGPRATNTTRRVGGRVELLGKIGAFSLTGTVFGQDLKSNNSQYVTGNGGPFMRTTPVAEPHDNILEDGTLGLDGPTPLGTLKVTLNHLHHHVLSGYDAQPLAQVISVPNSGAVYYDEEQNISLDTQEISLISPSRQKVRWLTGLFRGVSEEHFTPHLIDLFTQRTLYNEDRIDRLVDTALFGEVAWDVAPKWTLTTGLRYALDRHETESQINHVRLTNYKAFGDINGIINQDRLSYTASLRFQPTPQLLWYLQAGNGYRTGGFNTTTLAQTAIPSAYRGDALDSLETGWRYHTPHDQVRLTVALFHEYWRNIQSDQLRSTGLPITVNVGNGTNTGVEVEGDWKVTPVLALHAVAQVNDPRLTRPGPLYALDQNAGMPYIAKRSFSLSSVWDQPWRGHTLENSAIMSYRSQSPLNYGPLRDVRMNGYATLDLSSAFILTSLRYEARLDNATDSNSNSFAYGNPFTLGGSTQVTPLRPRTLWLSVDKAF